jgi:hypothetical protein
MFSISNLRLRNRPNPTKLTTPEFSSTAACMKEHTWTDTGATRTGAARRVPAKEAQAPTTGEAAVTRPAMASLMYLLVPGI